MTASAKNGQFLSKNPLTLSSTDFIFRFPTPKISPMKDPHYKATPKNWHKWLFFSFLCLAFTAISRQAVAQCSPDVEAPTAVCVESVTVKLDPGEVETVEATDLDDGSYDNCSASTALVFRLEEWPQDPTAPASSSLSFDNNDIGTHTVFLWVIDEAGNENACFVEIHVEDVCSQSALSLACNAEINLAIPTGDTVLVFPGDVLEGGPYCNQYGIEIEQLGIGGAFLALDGSHLGTHVAKVSDLVTGNACWGLLIVAGADCAVDETPPIIVCEENLTLQLGSNGQVTLQAAQLDAGSYDNCGPISLQLEFYPNSPTPPQTETIVFDASAIGPHEVVLWAIDQSGNSNICLSTVEITEPSCANTVLACQNEVIVQVSGFQPTTIFPQDILEGTNYCWSSLQLSLPPASALFPSLSFDLSDVGTQVVAVTDVTNNVTCWSEVFVTNACTDDVIPPVAVCDESVTVQLSVDGPDLTYLHAASLNDGSSDNCTAPGDLVFAVENFPPSPTMPSATQLALTETGLQVVAMWVADEAGNPNICLVEINVIPPKCSPDQTPPACVAPADTTVHSDDLAALILDPQNTEQLDQFFGEAYAWDYCGLDTVLQTYSVEADGCGQPRVITRSFWAIDLAGNTSVVAEQVITVLHDYSIALPDNYLPSDPTVEDIAITQGNGTNVAAAYQDLVFDYDCDGQPDFIERTHTIVNWCDYDPAQLEFVLPLLDQDGDGETEGYTVWVAPDTTYLLDENGNVVMPLGLKSSLYTYKQTIRYNYNDTLTVALAGQVFLDETGNCTLDSSDPGLEGWPVQAVGQASGKIYSATTAANGLYEINGICSVDTVLEVSLAVPFDYGQTCGTTWTVNVPHGSPGVQHIPVALDTECPLMVVDLSAPFLRRCFDNTYEVAYCNYSAATINGTWVVVTLDSFMGFTGSSIPATNLGNNVFSFEVGDLAAGECGSFTIDFLLSCDAVLGQTHCSEAHIFPDTLCPQLAGWSGANIEVEGVCQNGLVQLTIKNTGSGDMPGPLDFIVVEDVIMYMQDTFQLNAGQVKALPPISANGATWRLDAEQAPVHPYPGNVAVALEGCDGINQLGLVNLFPTENPNPFIGVDCQENIGSFDPNDKAAVPAGFGDDHFIRANTAIEYTVRFQNTGTDTAFQVVILDTLSSHLDPLSVRPGTGSHPFSFERLDGNVLRFRFSDIQLPDSGSNEPASHGYVTFQVQQQPNLPIGTLLENTASIYFDFNEPIRTNTVFHTIGENFIVINNVDDVNNGGALLVYPNPAAGYAVFEIPQGTDVHAGQFTLYDSRGGVVKMAQFDGHRYRFERGNLAPGMYHFTIGLEGGKRYSGKVVLQ